ncbi:seminal metalloprotease 1-like [Lutzomyia longipalpis]|uniref:seminal metalloprotease 1-like n=1 Tax=Lutzomyia longipalpis TaxID=7200 RepID=UPI0024838224|nr:seminal metalloprotease 1-like [Lutzomyia longipalpis]
MGCWSFVGFQNVDEQILNFNERCFGKIGVLFHELLHTVGLFHMQNDNTRDEYVQIVWDNIKDDMKQNFVKYDTTISSNYDVPYDYESVMHYAKKSFSKNGKDTIVPLQPNNAEMGQRLGPTEKDYERVRKMYKCSSSTNSS